MSTLKTVNIQHPSASTAAMTLNSDGTLGNASFANYPGRNRIINGSFSVWQRGTSFSNPSSNYTSDRWKCTQNSPTGNYTISRQSAELTGFQYCARVQRNSGQTATGGIFIGYAPESSDWIGMQGKTITMSFYARAGANYSSSSLGLNYQLNSGTSIDFHAFQAHTNEVSVIAGTSTLTTSWQRFYATGIVPISSTDMRINFSYVPTGTAGANDYFEITGIQVEEGIVPTTFEFKSYGHELRECQRYCVVYGGKSSYETMATGVGINGTVASFVFTLPVAMRTTPSSVQPSGSLRASNLVDSSPALTSLTLQGNFSSEKVVFVDGAASSGITAKVPFVLQANNSTASTVTISAEL